MLITIWRRSGPAVCHATRNYSNKVNPAQNLDTIKMAYSSYEITDGSVAHNPFLIMHGLFGSKGNWNSLCKAFQQRTQRKIFAVDARNHGESPHSTQHSYANLAEDVKALLDQFRIDKVALLGHSMGGRALMLFALKFPELVERLVVVDISPVRTSPSLHSMPSLFDYLLQVKLPESGSMSAARSNVDLQLAKKLEDRGLRAFLLTNLVQKGDGRYSWRVNMETLVANFKAHISTFPETEGLSYNGPTLFIGGGNSDYIDKSDQPKIRKLFPKADFEYIKDAGHWLHSEKPNEFLQLTVDFLNK